MPRGKRIKVYDVQQLAELGCTVKEIAAELGVSDRTLVHRYGPAMRLGRTRACARLRAKQFEVAMKGDRTMLIWLGKQMLGQKDEVKTTTEHTGGVLVGNLNLGKADTRELRRRLEAAVGRTLPARPRAVRGAGTSSDLVEAPAGSSEEPPIEASFAGEG